MSIANEIKRIQTAKNDIKTAIENKGVSVGDGLIDTYAEKISEISAGGGDGLKYKSGTVTFTSSSSGTVTHNFGVIPRIIMIWTEPAAEQENATLGGVYTSITPVELKAAFELYNNNLSFYSMLQTATQGIRNITETTFGLQRRNATVPIKTGVEYNWLVIE